MRVLIAMDSFKGSLSATEACEAVRKGLMGAMCGAGLADVGAGEGRATDAAAGAEAAEEGCEMSAAAGAACSEPCANFTFDLLPVADGGEGFAETIFAASGAATSGDTATSSGATAASNPAAAQLIYHEVRGPLGQATHAGFAMLPGKVAALDIASTSGLTLVAPGERDIMRANTYGLGELIARALDQGAQSLLIGLGGSATNDAGLGMLCALGARLLDKHGGDVSPIPSEFMRIARIDLSDLDARLREVEITVACDVKSPLIGDEGASAVFGPQKGATPEQVKWLDMALKHVAHVAETALCADTALHPGAGAAGGAGWCLNTLLNARLQSGIELVLAATHAEERITRCDVVIVGEGMSDAQSAQGKAPAGIAQLAARHGVPVILISGALGAGYEALYDEGVTAAFAAVNAPMTLNMAMARADELLAAAARNVGRLIMASFPNTNPSCP